MGNSNSVPIIVACIIALQLFFFVKNLLRMQTFRRIFSNGDSWDVSKNEVGFANGIKGDGNAIFESIKESINKYLGNNTGSVIDFQLIKDAIDRNCDSVEEEINTQTPVPLYCGLAGTMLGVIIGLGSLIFTDSITTLIVGSGDGNIAPAAHGINDLLTGVAWAMVASICGIAFTTINSLKFKGCKSEEDQGKNEFLAWLQSKLLPELPNDTSEALTKLVTNLNRFNNTFALNTSQLGGTLEKVNQSYRTQAQIIEMVHDMDVMKMAKANVNVLKELQECTDKLEQFNEYLESTRGYTINIQRFNDQFHKMAEEINVLKEIKAFVVRNKAEIARNITDEDAQLKQAMEKLKETSSRNIEELKKNLTLQTDQFRQFNQHMCDEYTQKIKALPNLASQLEQIGEIPRKLESLLQGIENSSARLVSAIDKRINAFAAVKGNSNTFTTIKNNSLPTWMKALLSVCTVLVTLAVMGIGLLMLIKKDKEDVPIVPVKEVLTVQSHDSVSTAQDSILQDSIFALKGN